jgi:uncharacterized delta-60 repeat protein
LTLEPLEDRMVLSPGLHGHAPFGDQGKVVTPFSGAQSDGARTVLAQPDGKLVEVGSTGANAALVRYTPAGALDTSFGTGGKVINSLPGNTSYFTDAALQADGGILAAGAYYNSSLYTGTYFEVVRYTAAGTLDNNFGTSGKINILAGTTGNALVGVEPDGKIVVAGSSTDNSIPATSFVLERYSACGTLDTAFGSGGQVTTHVGLYGNVSGIGFQPGGRIIVAGNVNDYSVPTASFVVAGYTAGGTLDGSFGSGGLAVTPIGGNGGATGAAVQADGQIVVAGTAYIYRPTFSYSLVAARYSAGGTLDTGFGSGGLASASALRAGGVAVQSDGKVVVAATAGGSLYTQFAAVRFTTAGGLDSGFGNGGTATSSVGSSDSASAIAIQGDGKIVLAGSAFVPATGNDFALTRFTSTGTVDTGFGSGGGVTTNFVGPVNATANSVVADRGGNLLVAGTTRSAGSSLSVARYLPNGQLDNGFGDGGKVQVTFNAYLGLNFFKAYVAVQQDGKIVLVGCSIEPGTTNDDIAMARLLPNGSLDPKFGSGGKVTTFSGSIRTDMAPSGGVVLQPDGKIVVAGYIEDYSKFPYVDKGVVLRYNDDGSLDTTFGSGGRTEFAFPANLELFRGVSAVALAPDGGIVVGGFVFDSNFNEDYFLERLQPNGVPDANFGTGGQVITSFTGYLDSGAPLAVRPDGKILVAGTTDDITAGTFDGVTDHVYFTLAQFTASGAVDTTFGTGGQASALSGTFDFISNTGNYAFLSNFSLLSNSQVVAVGQAFYQTDTSFSTSFALTRFLANGSQDSTFGNNGWVTTVFNGTDDNAAAVLIQKNGTILAVGYTFDPTGPGYEFGLAEYNADGTLVWGPKRGD